MNDDTYKRIRRDVITILGEIQEEYAGMLSAYGQVKDKEKAERWERNNMKTRYMKLSRLRDKLNTKIRWSWLTD